MLTIALPRLEREGNLQIQAAIPGDDPSWEGTDLRFSTPLSVSGEALWTPSGEVLLRLELRGTLDQECRRCLEPVKVEVGESLELLFVPPDEDDNGPRDLDEDVRILPVDTVELDLKESIREEVILSQTLLALCMPECRGLCPQCGTNLNQETCQCTVDEPDPRWDVLRALKKERE